MDLNKQTPRYNQVFPDLLLIGVEHKDSDLRGQRRAVNRFHQELDDLEHLAFEGFQALHQQLRRQPTYEAEAIRYFRGRKHFPDKVANYESVRERVGVTHAYFRTIQIARCLADVVIVAAQDGDTTPPTIERMGRELLGVQTRYSYYLSGIPIESGVETMKKLMISGIVDGGFEEIMETGTHFGSYLARVRDEVIYAPALEQLRTLSGKKGAILGSSHLKPLAERLRGPTPPCASWEEHIRTQDDNLQKGAACIAEFVRKYGGPNGDEEE